MSFEVIHDAEKDVAALVDAEFGRALGPIATGEKAVELLEKFAGAHGVDPATIPTPELEARWKDFVSALTGTVEDVEGEAHRVADEVLGEGHAQAGGAAAPSPTDPQEKPEQVPAGAVPATPTAEGEASASGSDTSPGDRVMPVTAETVKPGFAICPTCDGWGEIAAAQGVAQCPTCKGAGEVPAHEDAQAKEGTA